jgi:hypothetical protein
VTAALADVGEEDGEQAQQRQVGADAIDEGDAMRVGEPAEQRRSEPAAPKAKPKNTPAINPTRPGTSSCAKTTMAEKAEAKIRPMTTLSTPVQNKLA